MLSFFFYHIEIAKSKHELVNQYYYFWMLTMK